MLEYIEINSYSYGGSEMIKIWTEDGKIHYSVHCTMGIDKSNVDDDISEVSVDSFVCALEKINIERWHKTYEPKGYFVLDGECWDVSYKKSDCKVIKCEGENAYPTNWKTFIKLITSVTGRKETYL